MNCPETKFCIFYELDDSYAVQVGASLCSLYENNQDLPEIDTWIFTEDLKLENREKLQAIAGKFGRKIMFMDTETVYRMVSERCGADLMPDDRNATYIYYVRMFVGNMLAEKYDYALHVDGDTLVMGKIGEIFDYAGDNSISATIDIHTVPKKKSVGFKPEDPYFNCGILVLNLKRWVEDRCEQRIIDHITKAVSGYYLKDQDVMNLEFRGEIGTLPLKYNVFPLYPVINYRQLCFSMGRSNCYYSEEEYLAAEKDPVIVHLISTIEGRPWVEGNTSPYRAVWEEYARKAGWQEWDLSPRRERSLKYRKAAQKLGGSWGLVLMSNLLNVYVSIKMKIRNRKSRRAVGRKSE